MKDSEIHKSIKRMIDMWVPWRMKYDETPGVAIFVSHKGKTIYNSNFGFADIEAKEKIGGDTVFRVASMSKMFTAVAIMQLVDKNKLSLESKVSKYIKKFNTKDLRDITIRNLLSHQGGVFRDSSKNYWEENRFTNDVLKDITTKTKVTETLKHFKYSNFGFSILGKVIEKISGEKYGSYITEHIIKSLGLKNTYPDYSPTINKKMACGYSRYIPGEKRSVFEHFNALEYSPATGIASTTEDMAIFMNDITGQKSKILPEYLRKEMFHTYSKISSGEEYGLGFDIEYVDNKKIVGHGGGCNGYITFAATMPQEQFTVVVLTNCLGGPAWAISNGIFKLFSSAKNMQDIKKTANLKPCEGVYRDNWGETCVVAVGSSLVPFPVQTGKPFDGKTYLEPKGKKDFILHTNFSWGSPDELVVFEKLSGGEFQIMNWAGGKCKRV